MATATYPNARSNAAAVPSSDRSATVLALVCSLSRTLLQATHERLADAIKEALGTIGQFLQVDYSYLYLYSDDGTRIDRSFEWSASGNRVRKGRVTGMRLGSFNWSRRCIGRGGPIVLASLDDLPAWARSERLLWRCLGTTAMLANPLIHHGRVIGYFGLDSHSGPRLWSNEEIELSQVIAGLFANALYRYCAESQIREAQDTELRIAADIQSSLLTPTNVPSELPVRLGFVSHPSLLVDGDFMDFFYSTDSGLDLIMGDAMGKGVPAALMGAATRIAFLRARAELAECGRGATSTPGDVVTRVLGEIGPQLAGMSAFITLAFIRVQPGLRRLQILNAGHPPLLLRRHRRHEIVKFPSQIPPIGLMTEAMIRWHEVGYEPGDLLFACSDGLPEARNATGDFYGDERVHDFVRDSIDLDPQCMADRLFGNVRTFLSARKPQDDLSCLVVMFP